MGDYGRLHIFGKRIHHGLIGLILYNLGLKHTGLLLMKDDIADKEKWVTMQD